jgi:hypothetical protein
MRKLLLITLFFYGTMYVSGQKYSSINSVPNAPIFAFTHNSALEMLQDKEFLIRNTRIYRDFVEQLIESKQLEDSAITPTIIRSMAQANIILSNYPQAEKLYEVYLAKKPEFKLGAFPNQAFLMVKNSKAKSYKIALVDKTAENFSYIERDQMLPRYYGEKFPEDNLASILNFASIDTSRYFKILKLNLPYFDRMEKKLTLTEIIKVIQAYSNNIVANTLKNDLNNMVLDIKAAAKMQEEKIWSPKVYKFSPSDKIHTVIACNYQVFNKRLFPSKSIWVNKSEIAGNGIDDDKNGIIDDINGYQYKDGNETIKEPVTLTFQDRDSVAFMNEYSAVLKYYPNTRTLQQNYKEQFDHGNMAVELMLKNNPSVQLMGIEHNQYTVWVTTIKKSFTSDIKYNQYLVDSIVSLFTKSWTEMATYCNTKKVRVVEINSIGGQESDLIIEGCGKDETETKAFANFLFKKYITEMTNAYNQAPNTLFINAAGNSNNNVDSIPNIGTISLPNTLVVGAVYKDMKKTSYSDYGNGVDVFAPAHFFLPLTNAYAFVDTTSSGCSAAAPVVANLAIQLFALEPTLTAAKAKQLIIAGSDKEPYEKGINIINPKKSVALLKQK